MTQAFWGIDKSLDNNDSISIGDINELIELVLEEWWENKFWIEESLYSRLRYAYETRNDKIWMSDGSVEGDADYQWDLVRIIDWEYYICYEQFSEEEIRKIIATYVWDNDIEWFIKIANSFKQVDEDGDSILFSHLISKIPWSLTWWIGGIVDWMKIKLDGLMTLDEDEKTRDTQKIETKMNLSTKIEQSIDTSVIALLSYMTWVNYDWFSTAELIIYYKNKILCTIKKD